MRRFTIADQTMREKLIKITCRNFGESENSVRFFFDNFADFNNCVVCVEDGEITSQLHIVPMEIMDGGRALPAHYIYAASTLPEYRGRGNMTGLIDFACKLGASRGRLYSVLVPSNEGLFKFYKKCGYYKFFKVNRVELSAGEMRKIAGRVKECRSVNASFEDIEKIKRKIYVQDGDAVWGEAATKYALNLNVRLGGLNIGVERGHAMCYPLKGNKLKVMDVACEDEDIENLLGNIYNIFNSQDKYIIDFPLRQNFSKGKGEIVDLGMIRPINGKLRKASMAFIMEKIRKGPYLGVTME